MKKFFSILFTFFICTLIFYALKVEAILPLTGKIIVIDPGHGKEDVGTSYHNIYEKDLNLKISNYLEEELSSLGAIVKLTRNGDYDLSAPNASFRKRSDFDNRIKLINESKADMYLSIHINYLSDKNYKGPQVFYNNGNAKLAESIQKVMNENLKGKREIKEIPKSTYMYSKLKVKGVLIECGFLSNDEERNNLLKEEYQRKVAKAISKGVMEYYK